MNEKTFIKQTAKNLNTSEETVKEALFIMRRSGNISPARLAIEVGLIDNTKVRTANNAKFWKF